MESSIGSPIRQAAGLSKKQKMDSMFLPRFKINGECTLRPVKGVCEALGVCQSPNPSRSIYDELGVSPKKSRPSVPADKAFCDALGVSPKKGRYGEKCFFGTKRSAPSKLPALDGFDSPCVAQLDGLARVERKGPRTRAELLRERKKDIIPDLSYDLNGDGVVDPSEYFIARQFDVGKKNYLSDTERVKCREALANGFLDRFVLGTDVIGTRQQRGVVYQVDDFENLTHTYQHPKRANPAHWTKPELKQDRLRELRAAGAHDYEQWLQENPRRVPEAEPVQNPRRTHVLAENHASSTNVQRTQDDISYFRTKLGMHPCPTLLNPLRDDLQLNLNHQSHAKIRTQRELLATRKMKEQTDMELKRQQQELDFVPHSVRKSRKLEDELLAAKKSNATGTTLTQLKLDRKRERMEYEVAVASPTRRLPRHSDHATPFWMTTPDRLKNVSTLAPPFEPNDIGHKEEQEDAYQEVCQATNPNPPHRMTVNKRWSDSMCEERALGGKRLFDALPKAIISREEFLPCEHFSSFDVVRKASYQKIKEERQRNSEKMTSRIREDATKHDTGTVSTRLRSLDQTTSTLSLHRPETQVLAEARSLAGRLMRNTSAGSSFAHGLMRTYMLNSKTANAGLPLRKEKSSHETSTVLASEYSPGKQSRNISRKNSIDASCLTFATSSTSVPIHISIGQPISCTVIENKAPEVLAFANVENNESSPIRCGGFLESKAEKPGRQRSRPASGKHGVKTSTPPSLRTG